MAGAFQSRARRERLRGRNLVPEIAMYPVGQVPGPCSVRGKVIKAFVFPVHCRSNFVALQPRSNRNFESYSSPYRWGGNSFRRIFRFYFLIVPKVPFQKLCYAAFALICGRVDLSLLASFPFFFAFYIPKWINPRVGNRNFEFGSKMDRAVDCRKVIGRFSRIFIFFIRFDVDSLILCART